MVGSNFSLRPYPQLEDFGLFIIFGGLCLRQWFQYDHLIRCYFWLLRSQSAPSPEIVGSVGISLAHCLADSNLDGPQSSILVLHPPIQSQPLAPTPSQVKRNSSRSHSPGAFQ